MQLAKEEKYEDAIAILEKSLGKYDSHIARRYLAELYYQQKDIRKSAMYYYSVYDEFSFDPRFLTSLVLLNITMRDYSQARTLINRLKLIEPGYNAIPNLEAMLEGNTSNQ